MTDFQDDLREALATRAANLRPGADLGDLTLRMVRRERRKGAVLALVLVGVVGAGVVAVDATRRSPVVRAPNAAAGPRVVVGTGSRPKVAGALLGGPADRSTPLTVPTTSGPVGGMTGGISIGGGIGTTWMAILARSNWTP